MPLVLGFDITKTLVIVSHPRIKDSYTQSFLKNAQSDFDQVTWHPLDQLYPDCRIDVTHERRLLINYDRIIFQFPLYWYSAPALLKQWEDQVLSRRLANANHGGYLRHKQFGLVVTLGLPLKSYQAGGGEHFSLSTLLTPYQAVARRAGMHYLPPFLIAQFFYQTPASEAKILVDYQNYLTNQHPFNFRSRIQWVLKQLKTLAPASPTHRIIFRSVLAQIRRNQRQLDDLKRQVNLAKRRDDE